jgi:uncharacterized protein with HEPN domain
MSRNFRLYLNDILNSINKIKRYTKGMNREQLIANELTFDAVIYNLQIIGEAVKQIPLETRDRYSQVEWRKIAGLRDIVAHTYFKIDEQIVWDIIQNKLLDLQNKIESNIFCSSGNCFMITPLEDV